MVTKAGLMVLLLGVLLACRWGPAADVLFAVEDGGDVLVLTGSGKSLRRIEGRKGQQGLHEVGYFSPDVRPDRAAVVSVRCGIEWNEPPGARTWRLDRRDGCELVELPLAGGRKRVLLSGTGLDSPVWHAAGDRIALFREREVVVVRASSGEILARAAMEADSEGIRFHADPVGRGSRSYLRWDESGDRLLILLVTTRARRIGVFDPLESVVQWLDLPVPYFLYGKYHSDAHDVRRTGPSSYIATMVKRGLADRAAYRVLFGSLENPVLAPVFSADRRFYFYKTRREGIFAKWWVEGFDREEGRTFEVRTLRRAIYTE